MISVQGISRRSGHRKGILTLVRVFNPNWKLLISLAISADVFKPTLGHTKQ